MTGDRFPGLRRVFRLGVEARELEEELAFHFDQTVEELMANGQSREQAEREARRRFGDERFYRGELEKIDRSAAVGRRWAERWEVVRDSVGFALRRMRRSPGLALGVILTFALGIGANATMFGIVDRLLLTPPAHIEDPDAVRRLMIDRFERFTGSRATSDVMSYPDFQDLQQARSLSSVAGIAGRTLTLGRGPEARQVEAVLASAELFPLLGVRPVLGRFFGAEEEKPGAGRVVVIGHGFWKEQLGGDRNVLGRTLDLGYGPFTIIGVAPKGFTGVDLERVDVWLPLYPTAVLTQRGTSCVESRGCWWMRTVGRLAPGVTAEAARAELSMLHRRGRQEDIQRNGYDAKVEIVAAPLIAARGPNASNESRVAVWLAGISLIVLLIACANVANLLLARAVRQQREIGIRLALGSSRTRILGQVLTESLLFALLGGAAALLLTHFGGALVRGALLPDIAWEGTGVEARVLAIVAALALLAGVVAGAIPALQASRPDLTETLKSGSRTTSAPISRTRGALTVLQAALSLVLLVAAGLFVRSLNQVRSLDLGINPDGVLFVQSVFDQEVPRPERDAFVRRAAEHLDALPGVERAAAATGMPFYSSWATYLRVPGMDSVPRLPGGGPYINAVDSDYFAAFELEITRGRGFSPSDAAGAARVAVVSELMARTLWPGEDPLGKCLIIRTGEPQEPGPPCSEVVGVVENAHRIGLVEDEEAMQYFIPLAQLTGGERVEALVIRVRHGVEPATLVPVVQRELLALEPGLRFANVRPFRELIDPQARAWTLGATMFTLFGLLALLVAGIGLYSVLAFSVAQRTLELGIRSALGAPRQRLMGMVLGQALRIVAVGIALGLAIALLAAPRAEPLLYGVSPRDPLTIAAVVLVLLVVAVVAGTLPALRATRVNPSVALRAE